MNPADAADATREWLKPRFAIPFHYATNPALVGTPQEYIRALGPSPTKLITMNPGERVEF